MLVTGSGALRAAMAAAGALLLGGCALLGAALGEPENDRFERGLALLRQSDYRGAYAQLVELTLDQPLSKDGGRAVLVMTAAELDARNPARRLWAAAELAERYLNIPTAPEWTIPLAETFYLLAQELGAADEARAVAEARAQAAEREARAARAAAQQARVTAAQAVRRPTPRFAGTTVPARLEAVASERDRLAARVRQLEGQLAEQRRELERIRQTLSP